MHRIASIFLLAAALMGTPAYGDARPATTTPSMNFKMAQYRLGQMCVTRFGACRIRPRPTNTQCYCGEVPGVVR